MIVHLLDGTYELFRHFYGQRRFNRGKDARFGAVTGVLHTVLEMIETGATHLGVATDHVVESFRNHLWPGYKTSAESFPPEVLRDRDLALRFKDLATLRTNAPLFQSASELQWHGPTAAFSESAGRLGDARLLSRCLRAAGFEV